VPETEDDDLLVILKIACMSELQGTEITITLIPVGANLDIIQVNASRNIIH
jgi:hypothetical protein